MGNVANSAIGFTVSEGFLNHLAAASIGEGIDMGHTEKTFGLPMMGDVELKVSLTITGVSFEMSEDHPDSLLATIRAKGEIELGGDVPMQAFPGPVRVRGDVRVKPVIEYGRKQSLTAILDVSESELVSATLEGIDGMPAGAEAQLQMSQMLFAAVGGDLFLDLAAELGHVGIEKRAGTVPELAEMGVVAGPAEVIIDEGEMWVGFAGHDDLVGNAQRVRVSFGECGVSIASDALGAAVNVATSAALGMKAPLDHEMASSNGSVQGRVRNLRLVDSLVLPDLRPGLRYSVEPTLVGDMIDIKLSEAWVELPLVPSFVNGFSRLIGGVIAAAPLVRQLPSSFLIPTDPDGEGAAVLRVIDLETSEDGLDLVLTIETDT